MKILLAVLLLSQVSVSGRCLNEYTHFMVCNWNRVSINPIPYEVTLNGWAHDSGHLKRLRFTKCQEFLYPDKGTLVFRLVKSEVHMTCFEVEEYDLFLPSVLNLEAAHE